MSLGEKPKPEPTREEELADLKLEDQIKLAHVNSLIAYHFAAMTESVTDGAGDVHRELADAFTESADGTVFARYFEDGDWRTVELPEELLREYVELKTLADSIVKFVEKLTLVERHWDEKHRERHGLLQHLREKSKVEKLKMMPQGRYVSKGASYNALAPVYVKTGMQWLRDGRDHVEAANLPGDLVPLVIA